MSSFKVRKKQIAFAIVLFPEARYPVRTVCECMELAHTWARVFYDGVCNTDIGKSKEYEEQCLDVWDLMFENRIGIPRDLTEKLTEM